MDAASEIRSTPTMGRRSRVLPRVVGMLALAAIVAVFVVTRGPGAAGDAPLTLGIAALRQAIVAHDDACFAQAEQALAEAAGGVVFEPYPMFLLQLAKGIREGRVAGADAAVNSVLAALARADWDAASRALDEVPAEREGRNWLVRAVADLRRKYPLQNCRFDPM